MILRVGDIVKHTEIGVNPKYNEAVGLGKIISIFNSRVRVKWEKIKKARNYKEENLVRVENEIRQ